MDRSSLGERAILCLVMLSLLASVGRAGTVYAVISAKTFGTLDLNTGNFTLIGSLGIPAPFAVGLAELGGIYYTVGAATGALYSIDTASGTATLIGNGTQTYGGIGSTLTGLYGFDTNWDLLSINPATGATSVIGPTGFSSGGNTTFSAGSSTLYAASAGNLYTISTSTGAASLVGSLSPGAGMGGLAFIDGTLYGSELLDPPFPIDTINTATGQATIGPALTGVNAGGAIYGLAPTQQSLSTPEPATLALLFVGLGVFPLIRTGINRARR
jgi:hypothetical protein